jgi:hypothetical protein
MKSVIAVLALISSVAFAAAPSTTSVEKDHKALVSSSPAPATTVTPEPVCKNRDNCGK